MADANVLLSPIPSSNTNTTITPTHNIGATSKNTSTVTLTPGKLLNSSPYAKPALVSRRESGTKATAAASTLRSVTATSNNIHTSDPSINANDSQIQRTVIPHSTAMTKSDTTTVTTSTGTSNGTTQTTPLTSPMSHVLSKITPDKEAEASLPPFSFSKRPIDSPKHRVSSLSFSDPSVLSSYATEPKDQIIKKKPSPPPPPEVDYNDQIRFPRMSTTYYTKRNSLEIAPTISADSSNTGGSNETITCNPKNDYKPATFDLTKPLRRLSLPSKQERPMSSELNEADGLLLEQYTANNYIYERKMNRDKLRAIMNDKTPIAAPSQPPRLRNQSSFPKLKDNSPRSLHQVYELKKPLLTPAVLRPAYTNEESSSQTQSQLTVSRLQIETPPRKTVYTVSAPESSVELDIEPIHTHWKSNTTTKNCMSCFKPFRNSLLSLIYDVSNKRHHCRFCGFIFCIDCLVQDNETSYNQSVTLLDAQAQFVIPVFKNLDQIPSQGYKSFKVCKKCNIDYNALVEDINRSLEDGEWKYLSNSTRDDLKKLPFICVENPYVGNTTRFRVNTDSANKQEGFRGKASGIGEVPSDWAWSSF